MTPRSLCDATKAPSKAASANRASFLLIAGEDGESWCAAAKELAADTGVPLDVVRIGHLDGAIYDSRCAWLWYRQIDSDGAILVRPDRFIGWRAPSSAEDPRRELATALSRILARPVDAAVLAGAASAETAELGPESSRRQLADA